MPRLTTLRTATIGGFRSLLYRAGPFLARRFNRDVIDNEGRAVRKARYQVQLASHGLNVAAKRWKQNVASAFDSRNRILTHAQARSQVFSRAFHGLTQVGP
jgi:hypothetical protein